jgi:hypothetical protein
VAVEGFLNEIGLVALATFGLFHGCLQQHYPALVLHLEALLRENVPELTGMRQKVPLDSEQSLSQQPLCYRQDRHTPYHLQQHHSQFLLFVRLFFLHPTYLSDDSQLFIVISTFFIVDDKQLGYRADPTPIMPEQLKEKIWPLAY